jgi:ubiquinone biosynthesis protein COQ4
MTDAPAASPTKRERDRMRPLEAWRALRALARDPDDTAQVFRIVRALPSGDRVRRRLRRRESGRRLLAERPDLLAALADREALLAMPPGSLGRCYAEFMSEEQISADGLVGASLEAGESRPVDEEQQYVGARLRDMHDLWHVVTGYGRDLLGEAALLAFTFAQTRTLGIGVIVGHALWKARGDFAPARGIIARGFRRGLRAEWLPAQPWEELLPRPLDEVRERLRVGEPPTYTQLRSAGAPAVAASPGSG